MIVESSVSVVAVPPEVAFAVSGTTGETRLRWDRSSVGALLGQPPPRQGRAHPDPAPVGLRMVTSTSPAT